MELTQKGEMVSRLQAKAGQIGKILNNLEKYNHLVKDAEKKSLEKRYSHNRNETKCAIKNVESPDAIATSSDSAKKKKIESQADETHINSDHPNADV